MNFRTLSLLLLAVAAPASTSAAQFDQVDEAWARVRTDPVFGALQPIEVEATPDGGVLVLGLARQLPVDAFDTTASIVLTKLDENGDFQWSEPFSTPPVDHVSYTFSGGRYADAAVDAQGEAIVVMQGNGGSFLRRYGVDGGLVWSVFLPLRSFPGTGGWGDYKAGYVAIAPSGDIVVVGVVIQNYPRADVRVFAPDGSLRWDWRGDGGSNATSTATVYPFGFSIGPDGLIYVYGLGDIPGFQSYGRMVALDSGGSYLWRHEGSRFNVPILGVAFDGQGRAVVPSSVSNELAIKKLRADGTEVFTSSGFAGAHASLATSIAVDAFDRITVGGSFVQQAGSPAFREASIFRFDASGAFLGRNVPSPVVSGQDSQVLALAVTPRNDVIAFGTSGTGTDQTLLARFAPDGTERWALQRRGKRPLESRSSSVKLGLTVDPMGNPMTLSELQLSGEFPNVALGLDVVKFVQNGPAGTTYCSPAVANSSGLPATIAALGPSSLGPDNVTLRADHLPEGALTLFLASQMQGQVPGAGGGEGTLCLGGAIGRFMLPGQVRVAGADGSAALKLLVGALPQPTGAVAASVGETWSFQAWYRDANPSSTSNLTDGVAVTWQ